MRKFHGEGSSRQKTAPSVRRSIGKADPLNVGATWPSRVRETSGMDPQVYEYYVDGFREDDRLRQRAHGVLERVRTQELLARFLPPPPARVLDVGGGTGVHAEWLAEFGYTVQLIDPVGEHVAVAARLSGVSAAVGDARALVQQDDTQDAVLLLGPLYHLTEREDRLQALREARRVGRPGAPVIVCRNQPLRHIDGPGQRRAAYR